MVRNNGPVIRNPRFAPDDLDFVLGTDRDIRIRLRASAIAVDDGDTDLPALFKSDVGAANHPPIAADSLLVANTTSDGGIGLIVNDGGDSRMPVWLEGSTGRVLVSNGADAPLPKSPLHVWLGDSGQATPQATTHVAIENDGATGISIITPGNAIGYLYFGDPDMSGAGAIKYDHTNVRMAVRVENDDRIYITTTSFAFQQETTISTGANALILDPTTDVQIANGKGMVIGHTDQVTVGGLLDYTTAAKPELQVLGTGSADSAMLLALFSSTDSRAPVFSFLKSDNSTIGGFDPVVDGEALGGLQWLGDDGTDYQSIAAAIRAVVDGSPGTGDMPGALLFLTTPNGAEYPNERWRITSVGELSSLGAVSNVTADGAVVASGGLAFTDVVNAWLDDATHGTGTVTHYIGNETIDTTASYRAAKENFAPVGGSARQHLNALGGLLKEYDYKNGIGHFVGLVAEDVQEVLPQYVIGGEQLSLRYQYMVGPLLWGQQDHEERINKLEAQITGGKV